MRFFTESQKLFNSTSSEDTSFDFNLPLNAREYGSLHPIKIVESKIYDIFHSMGLI